MRAVGGWRYSQTAVHYAGGFGQLLAILGVGIVALFCLWLLWKLNK